MTSTPQPALNLSAEHCVNPDRSDLKQLIDVGDFVGVSGDIKKTDRGEVSVAANRIQILTKSLRPLPDKWKGLADVEKRYRQRSAALTKP